MLKACLHYSYEQNFTLKGINISVVLGFYGKLTIHIESMNLNGSEDRLAVIRDGNGFTFNKLLVKLSFLAP